MNSTYDYDPASRKDELVNMVKKALEIMVPVLRPDLAVVVQAFPWCESITFPVFRSITRSIFASDLYPVMVSRHVIQEGNGGGTRVFEAVPR